MPPPTDFALLQQWQRERDAHAFKALTQRYGGMVFNVCNRVLRNAADAEEIAQECFLKLAQHPEAPERAVGAWLHSVALRTSINRIRSDQRRRDRESAYETERPATVEFSARDLIEHVDTAINALPADLRACIVGHFLANRPQQEIALELGVSTRTVRRKTDEAISRVRKTLELKGVRLSAGALSIALTGLGAGAMSPTLTIALGKVAVGSGPIFSTAGWAAAGNLTTLGALITMKNAMWAVACVGVIGLVLWWSVGQPAAPPAPPESIASEHDVTLVQNPDAERPAADLSAPDVAPEPETGALNSDASALVSAAAIPPIANPTRFATLAGQVVDDGGQPVAGAAVTLAVAGLADSALDTVAVPGYPAAGADSDENLLAARRDRALELALAAPGHQYSATSDKDGAFQISGIRFAGEAYVVATAPDLAMHPAKSTIVENERAEVQLSLRPARTIRGMVLDAGGTPIAGATVASIAQTSVARGPNGDAIVGGGGTGAPVMTPFRARTDTAGQFMLALADADYAALLVEAETFGAEIFPEIPVGTDTLQRLAWTREPATLRGQILLDNGAPAPNYYVHLAGSVAPETVQKRSISSGAVQRSNPEGSKAGSGETVMKSGTSDSSRSGGRVTSGGGGGGSGGSGGGGFGGGGGGFSFGASGGAGMAGGPMQMPYRGATRQIETDAEGCFEVRALSAVEQYTATIYDGDGRKVGVTEAPRTAMESGHVWRYTLVSPLRVTGRVVGITSGEGLDGILVRGFPRDGSDPFGQQDTTRTAADGSFTLEMFRDEGAYLIMPVVDGNAPLMPDAPYSIALDIRRAEPQVITLQLPDPWSRRFRLMDGSNKPVAGARVQLQTRNLDGGGFFKDLPGVVSDPLGYLAVDGLSGDAEVQAVFSIEGYLDGMSSWKKATDGQRDATEGVTLYADASATFRVVTKAGEPVRDASLFCTARYADDQEGVWSLRSDKEGWVALEEVLPATLVDLEVRIAAEAPSNVAMGGFGEMPPQLRAKITAREARRAEEAGTPVGRLDGIQLSDGVVNELGDVILE